MLKRFVISLCVLGSLMMQTGFAQQFFSTQFSPVEEQAKFREILAAGGFDFVSSEEGPLLDQIIAAQKAGSGGIDVIGALHGSFLPCQGKCLSQYDRCR
ncbi:MAG: hypothetical protein R2880_09935 [Deinococcales bacterium]